MRFALPSCRRGRLSTVVTAAAVIGLSVAGSSSFTRSSGAPGSQPSDPPSNGIHEHHGTDGEIDVNVCSDATPPGFAHCLARVRTEPAAAKRRPAGKGLRPSAGTLGDGGAYSPAYLQSAYNAPSATAGTGQTVAIVDAYDSPTVAADLSYYRSYYGLPPCTVANGCFRKIDQRGGTNYPRPDVSWAAEAALDLDMVSALCPNCRILLVEAASSSLADLGAAVNQAVTQGAMVVSNSYGGSEYPGQSSDSAAYFNHPGVAVVVSSGDSGYGVQFPASSRYVTAVGGTHLIQNSDTGSRDGSETAWSNAGSGCSSYEPKPSWQHDPSCHTRTVADVSAVADPSTGVWVYNTYASTRSWQIYGGTSAAAPIIGAMYALAGNPPSFSQPASFPYANPTALNDVVSGSNGFCFYSYLCAAGPGYDGPTGLGTPNSASAFAANASPPPPPLPPPPLPPPLPPPPPSPPSAPVGLSATAGDAKVQLAWGAPGSTGAAAVTYSIYRGTSPGGETLLKTGIAGTSYTDSPLSNGTNYYYYVTADSSAGSSPFSNEASATPTGILGPPSNLAAATASRGILLTWSAPSSNGGSAVTKYKLYRGRSASGESLFFTVSCSTATCSYADTTTARRAIYYYQVAAVNATTAGPLSNQASAKAG